MSAKKPQILKGFRDFLPEKMALRNEVISRLRKVFDGYGFEELQTPALEYKEVLTGKYGHEAEKLMYLFKDLGNRDIGLRYDLTVPLARVVGSYNLKTPLRIYRVQPVWRADKPQKGRLRELVQCDFDIVGSSSPLSDAEIIAVLNDSLKSLGFLNYTIKVNSRQVLFNCLKLTKIDKDKHFTILQTLDKLEKIGKEKTKKELLSKGISESQTDGIFESLEKSQADEFLEKTLKYSAQMGVLRNLVFEKTLTRGLDYYTGPVFEAFLGDVNIGSVSGGGRYDNLIKNPSGVTIPAVGASIGIDRVCEAIEESELYKNVDYQKETKVLVTIFSENLTGKSIEISSLLRNSGLRTEIYPDESFKLDKQLKYANDKNIPWVVIIGPKETISNSVILKNLASKKQETIPVQALLTRVK